VEEIKYFGRTLTNQNSIQEEIKNRSNSKNTRYHSEQNLSLSILLSKNLKSKIYRIVILLVFYGCETWSLTLMEKIRLRVSENRLLKRIFGPKRDEVKGEWRKLYNEELNDLYWSPNVVWVIKSRIMRWAGHVARMGERRSVYWVLVGIPDVKRALGRPRRKWYHNIKLDLQEVACGVWTGSMLLSIGTGGGHLGIRQ